MEIKAESIAKGTVFLILITFIARILGFITNIVLAQSFGISRSFDIFQFALSIQDVIGAMLLVAVRMTFIPIYIDYLTEKREKEAKEYANVLITVMLLISAGIVVMVMMLAPFLVKYLSGFKCGDFSLAIKLMIISIFLIVPFVFSNLLIYILNAHKHFSTPALAGVFTAFIPILMVLILRDEIGIFSIVWALIIAALLNALIMHVITRKSGYEYKINLNILKHRGIFKTFEISLPLLIVAAGTQINTTVDKIMASHLSAGSVSALFYARTIREIPLTLLALPLVSVIFPYFAESVSKKDTKRLIHHFSKAIRMTGFVLIPSTVALLVLHQPFLRLFYQHGAFNSLASGLTSSAIIYYSIGTVWYGINFFSAGVFYALKDIRTILFTGLAAIGTNIILNWILMKYMFHAGIALSTSLVEIGATILLLIILRKRFGSINGRRIVRSYLKIGAASMVMSIVCYFSIIWLSGLHFGAVLVISGFFGLLIYVIMGFLLKIEELGEIFQKIPFNKIGLANLWEVSGF